MSGRCKDCKFWNPYMPVCPTRGWCSSGKLVDQSESYGMNLGAEDELSYSDAEGYVANLHTGPEFGCVHFKEKADAGQDQGQEVDAEGSQAVEEGERERWPGGGDGCGEEVDVEAGEEGVTKSAAERSSRCTFDLDKLNRALGIARIRKRYWSLLESDIGTFPCQQLNTSEVIQFVVGKMLDPEVCAKVRATAMVPIDIES